MLNVLIVDDSNFMRKNLGLMFSSLGHNVVGEAGDGLEAFKAYEKHKPDLMTMDVTMPKMEGVDAVRNIIKSFPDAKIVMVSAQKDRDVVKEAIVAGAMHYLAKPVRTENLIKAIEKVFPDGLPVRKTKEDPFKDISFHMELKDDKFTATIHNNASGHPIRLFPDAIKGLGYVTPLNLTIDYHETENLPKEIREMVVSSVKRINEAGGKVKLISKSEEPEE